ncbi:hypothetical protein N1851_020090 [Merluccius polli]|uniref:Uncharacterized protein n=1 Tax=Merluccius polli TaxID=89951 RepID=A0AA47MLC2_MERPO|nr:hypothetical protein N1851_020090 [Merluccius polli]
MIQWVIEQEKAISQVLKLIKKTWHLAPTWQEMDVLESMSKSISPLIEFTDALSGEEYAGNIHRGVSTADKKLQKEESEALFPPGIDVLCISKL